MRFAALSLFILALSGSFGLHASIVNTKHNLSISNTAGTIKAQTETEVCVFCHIPHQARPEGKPLWNRSMPTSNYVMYNSDYLRRIGYPDAASDLGTLNDTPGALSRQCLSCHDGTVAVGAVYKVRRQQMNGSTIAMNGVSGAGTIPVSSSASLGIDLTHQHPIGFEYNPNISINFGTGTRTSELKDPPDSPIKLFTYGGKKYIECSSCHDPHKNNKKFLRVDSGANHGQNVKNTCLSCHDKSGGAPWPTVHETIGAPYTDPQVISRYGTASPADLFCVNCHTPHNGEGEYLLRKVEQQTCFKGAGSSAGLTSCHGTGGSGVDIESVLAKSYAHPVSTIDGIHTDIDVLYGYDVSGSEMTDTAGRGGVSWGSNKHAECMDCHNPHRTGSNIHVPDTQWYPDNPTNAVSDVLRNVTGVEPNWPTAWTQPTTFTTLESSTKEYQICFKCHSYWGLGVATDGVTNYPSMSDPVNTPYTDVAWEMNINNRSGHPVVINALNRTGSYAPKQLDSRQLTAPWSNAPGAVTMYCSDCHGSDAEMTGDPKGPHGSNLKFMLKGENNYWPTKPDGVTLYDTNDIGNGGDTGLFCKNCHDLNEPHKNQWASWMRNRNFSCVTCHVAVPHGSPISRLIGYSNFPAPYNYKGNSLRVTGFVKNGLTNINRGDVSGSGCGGGMCHGFSSGGSFDSNPFP